MVLTGAVAVCVSRGVDHVLLPIQQVHREGLHRALGDLEARPRGNVREDSQVDRVVGAV